MAVVCGVVLCEAYGAPAVPKKDVITYTIPVSALKRGANAFSVKVPAGGEFRDFVLRVRH